MKRQNLLHGIAACLLLISLNSCKNKTTMMPEEIVDTTTVVDTTPIAVVVDTWEEIDTTDNAIFSEAELEAQLMAEIQKNLIVLHFAYNSYALETTSLEDLKKAADFLKVETGLRVRLDGHCDERGTTEYNLALGEKRALAVKDVLVRFGIDPRRIETTSFGKENPLVLGCTDEACYSQNRRVEYTVIQ